MEDNVVKRCNLLKIIKKPNSIHSVDTKRAAAFMHHLDLSLDIHSTSTGTIQEMKLLLL